MNADELVELWKTLFPSSYVRSIEGGAGDDVVHASAEIFARSAVATCKNQQRLFIKPHSKQASGPASSGEYARGPVTIQRADTSQTLTIPAGAKVRFVVPDSFGGERHGMRFELVSDVFFMIGESSKTASAIAETIGEEGNFSVRNGEFDLAGRRDFSSALVDALGLSLDLSSSPDRVSTADVSRVVVILDGSNSGEFVRISSISGSTITLDTPVDVATTDVALFEWEDVGVSISSIGPMTGGLDAWLDEHGEERCVRRQAAESDDAYRSRMCALADTVSPNAIRRTISRILSPLGIGWAYKDNAIGLALDAMAWDTSEGGAWLLLDSMRQVRYFVVCVGLSNDGDIGFPFDDVGPFPSSFYENALDEGFLDGRAFEWEAAIASLCAALDVIRGAGVAFDIILDPSL